MYAVSLATLMTTAIQPAGGARKPGLSMWFDKLAPWVANKAETGNGRRASWGTLGRLRVWTVLIPGGPPQFMDRTASPGKLLRLAGGAPALHTTMDVQVQVALHSVQLCTEYAEVVYLSMRVHTFEPWKCRIMYCYVCRSTYERPLKYAPADDVGPYRGA